MWRFAVASVTSVAAAIIDGDDFDPDLVCVCVFIHVVDCVVVGGVVVGGGGVINVIAAAAANNVPAVVNDILCFLLLRSDSDSSLLFDY